MALFRQNGVRSFCGPHTTAQRRLGAMGFGSLQPRIYLESETPSKQVAQQVAVALDNAPTQSTPAIKRN